MGARLDRIEQHILSLTGVTGEMARGVRDLVQGLAADRAAFREALREMSGFVATAGLEMNQLSRQVQRLGETTEAGFAQVQMLVAENNRQVVENNQQIAENNVAICRLLDILARGRGDGQGPPQ